MNMEDQSNGNQYRIDLRQFMGGRPTIASPQFSSFIPLPSTSLPTELFPCHSGNQQHNYDLMMLMPRSGLSLQEFQGEHSGPGTAITSSGNMQCGAPANAAAATSSSCLLPHGLIGAGRIGEGEVGCFNAFGGVGSGDIGGTGRWPRQETLTLLEIRSSLDSKFKEANQKGPLWEEVSRMMAEEHGYQRSAKKCREKFENLYKYYKKTKEGKAGRQDGKHYRFFRQLEALYGEPSAAAAAHESSFVGNAMAFQHGGGNNSNQGNYSVEALHSQKTSRGSLSISESLEYDTSTEEDDRSTGTVGENENCSTDRLRKKKKNTKTWKLKIKEFLGGQMRELMERQEAWLLKLTNTLEEKEKERLRKEEEWRKKEADRVDREHKFWAKEREWIEARDAALMEALQNIAGRDASIPSPEAMLTMRDQIHHQTLNAHDRIRGGEFKEGNKKRRENSGYFLSYESFYNPGDGGTNYCDMNGQCDNNGTSPANSNAGNAVNDNCFRFLMSGNDGDNVWVAKEINNGR